MNTNHDDITTDLEEEKLLAELKNVKLDNVGKGKLSLTDRRIEFEHRSSLLSPPRLEFSVDLSEVYSARVKDTSNTLVLEWLDENGERVVSTLNLPEGDAATSLCRALTKKLRILRQVAELQERRACYQSFLWKTAYHVWGIVGLLSQIVRDLRDEDWDTVDASINKARETAKVLALECGIDITDQVHALADTVSTRDTALVLRSVVATIESIGTSLQNDLPPDAEWQEFALDSQIGLTWLDMRYIFLFAGRRRLLSLWQESGETEKIEDSLPRLVTLLSILADRISMGSQLESSVGQDASSIADSVESAAQNLETWLKINTGTA
ncbi:MAG: hypothetical protein MUP21_08285 [Dehalococcoidia bacterium]|nr:hypothetical protein [Dehalococcoidia bacterium]